MQDLAWKCGAFGQLQQFRIETSPYWFWFGRHENRFILNLKIALEIFKQSLTEILSFVIGCTLSFETMNMVIIFFACSAIIMGEFVHNDGLILVVGIFGEISAHQNQKFKYVYSYYKTPIMINNTQFYSIQHIMKVTPIEPIDVAFVVKKQSGSGMFKNQRLLLIKSGFISYFSHIPKYYVGNVRSLQLSGELPKMTLSATDVVSIQRKAKYLHMKFNKKELINMEKLKKLVEGAKNQQQNGSGEMQEWTFKCDNVQEAQIFIKQVLSYKNNPQFKPKIQNIISGYRQGKKGFHPESVKMPALNPTHRFSEQPETVLKKVRTNTVCQKLSQDHQNLFVLQQSNKKQVSPIQEKEIQEENDQELPEIKKETQQPQQPISQPSQQPSKSQPKQSSPLPQQNQQQINSYSKQTFPYFPFVKAKTNLKKQIAKDLNFGKNIKQDKSLVEKLQNNGLKNIKKQQTLPKKVKPSKITPTKRSLTFDKKQVVEEKEEVPIDSSSANRSSSWSDLKRLKRAYSLIGSSLRKESKDQQVEEKVAKKQEQSNLKSGQVVPNQISHQYEFGPPFLSESTFIIEQKSKEINLDQTQVDNITNWVEKQSQNIHCQNNNHEIIGKNSSPLNSAQEAQLTEQKVIQIEEVKDNRKHEIVTEIIKQNELLSSKDIEIEPNIIVKSDQNMFVLQIQEENPPIKTIDRQTSKIESQIQITKQVSQSQQIIVEEIVDTNEMVVVQQEQQVQSNLFILNGEQKLSGSQNQVKEVQEINQTKQAKPIPTPSLSENLIGTNQIAESWSKFQKKILNQIGQPNMEVIVKQSSIAAIKVYENPNSQIQPVFDKKSQKQSELLQNLDTNTKNQNLIKISEKDEELEQMKEQLQEIVQKLGKDKAQEKYSENEKQKQKQEPTPELKSVQVPKSDQIQTKVEQPQQKQEKGQQQLQKEQEQQKPGTIVMITNKQVLGTTKEQQLKVVGYSSTIIQEQNDDEKQIKAGKSSEEILIIEEESIQEGSQHSYQQNQNKIGIAAENYENISYGQHKDKNYDVISFQNLQIASNQPNNEVLMTPRFWEDEELQSPIIDSLENDKHNKQKRKAYEKLVESGQKQRQKIKNIQNQQIEKQAITYTHHLLDIHKQDELSQTMRKIANKFKTNQMQQTPHPIALELLAIRNQNLYRSAAMELMISFVDGHYREEGVDCEGIMFGKRIKCDGWSLYFCCDQEVYMKMFQFYQTFCIQCQSLSKSIKYRAPKLCGLKYKGYFGIFLQQPQPINMYLSTTAINILQKVLGQELYQQIKNQIIMGEDRQTNQFIIYISPDYLEQWQSKHPIQCNVGSENRQIVQLGLDDIENVVQYAWQEYVQCSDQEQDKAKKLETIQILFKSYYLNLKHTPNDKIQVNQTCKLEQIACPTSCQIDRIFTNLTANLSAQSTSKAVQILYWKALKLLAMSDLHPQQHTDLCEYLSILSTAAELYVKEGKYMFAHQICTYNLQVLLGQESIKYLPQLKISQTKLYLMLRLSTDEQITKICQFLSINLTLSLECQSKIKNQQSSQIHELYSIIITTMNEVLSIATSIVGGHHRSILELAVNHAYYSIILHEVYYQFLVMLRQGQREDVSDQIFKCKQKSYQFAQFLMKISSTQMRKKQITPIVVINYIDFLISCSQYKQAINIIENSLNLAQGKVTSMIQLNCRRDICYAYTSDPRRANYQKFIEYLSFYLQGITSTNTLSLNLDRIKATDHVSIIKTIIMIVCGEFAYNDEQIFYQVKAIVKKFDLENSIGDEIFQECLQQLEPPIQKRISSKLFS